MVESEHEAATGWARFILTANCSMTWGQTLTFLALAGLVMASIGVGFALLGLWLVLPFSGAEWLLLAYAFKVSVDKSRLREVLTIDDATVRLERGRDAPEQVYQFQRAWLTLDLIEAEYGGHPSRLALRSHGKQVEIGGFLVEAERKQLLHELRKILHQK